MSKYSYAEMRKAATAGRRIGGYQGKDVFAESKYHYAPERMKGSYYLLYDDGYKFVLDGWIVGTLDEHGSLDLAEVQKIWHAPAKFEKPTAFQGSKSVPASDYSAFVAGAKEGDTSVLVSTDDFFISLDREINELLATQFEFKGVEWAPKS